jgi:predicted acyltransferase
MDRLRFTALDVFRGLTVCVMIVVNTSGAGAEPYYQLQHATWFGFTLADLVFPSFLFAVGNSMAFASRRTLPNDQFLLKVAKRTALIFLLGYLMYWFPFVHQVADGSWAFNDIGQTRIMGVLQRIALCYGAAALAARYLPVKGIIALCTALLFGYWGALMAFGPAGEQLSMVGNIGAQIDRAVLGLDHMYRGGAKGYEPEGLFSTVPAIVNVLAGYLAGLAIVKASDHRTAVSKMLVAGVALVAAGLIWSLFFPLSKRLWTSSFVLLTIGIDCLILAALITYTEIQKLNFGVKFFEIFGKNPLIIYLFSELLVISLQTFTTPAGTKLYDWVGIHLFQAILPGAIGSLVCAIVYMLACWLLGWWMDRKNIIIKL